MPNQATLRLTRTMLVRLTGGFMSLGGTVFCMAGYGVGMRAPSRLATLFAMGASTGLLVLVLWLIAHVRSPEASDASAPLGGHR